MCDRDGMACIRLFLGPMLRLVQSVEQLIRLHTELLVRQLAMPPAQPDGLTVPIVFFRDWCTQMGQL